MDISHIHAAHYEHNIKEMLAVRGASLGGLLSFIGIIYVIGLMINYWWITFGLVVAVVLWDHCKSKSVTRPTNTSQAKYSNRR